MPVKDKKRYNAYMKKYMLARYHEVRARLLNLLGNKCAICYSTEDLEIDHIDYKQKKFNIAKCYSYSDEKLFKELAKCRLLCTKCHEKKSIEERGRNSRSQHGTVACYRHGKCRCVLCKEAWKLYTREYRKRRKLRMGTLVVEET